MKQDKMIAIILAAGQGKRMNSGVAKQYMLIKEKPVLFYSLKAFEESEIDEIILVVGKGQAEYCQNEFAVKYRFHKIKKIVEGGKERYHSVYNGLNQTKDADYVLIHDGARPFITVDMINSLLEEVKKYKACVVGVPSKDTIKIVNQQRQVVETPDRQLVWNIQTPQAFQYLLIKKAYDTLMKLKKINVTDDAMVVETILNYPIQMIQGNYQNIKITTPEDIKMAEAFMSSL